MTFSSPKAPILHRIGIAIFGRPIQALLDWQSASGYRRVRGLPKNTTPALRDAAVRRAQRARVVSYQWAEKVFRQKSGFPRPGWAARGGLDAWNEIVTNGAAKSISMEYLKKSHLLSRLLWAPDAPWDNSECETDMLSLLYAHARFIAGNTCSAYSGGSILIGIPEHLPHLAIHFRKEITLLDPEWHLRNEMNEHVYQTVSQEQSWREKVAFAKNTQEVFLEKEELNAATSESFTPSRRSRARL